MASIVWRFKKNHVLFNKIFIISPKLTGFYLNCFDKVALIKIAIRIISSKEIG